jgi:hypothetical protein
MTIAVGRSVVRWLARPMLTVWVAAALLGLSAPHNVAAQKKPAPPAKLEGTAYITPTCGCCSKWVDHLTAAGFSIKREVTNDLNTVAARQKVPEQLRTCHTATIGKYIVEGHVPADVIRQLLKEQPAISGIAVPGMPMGSPGMEGPMPRSYSIIAFKADGSTYEYARR